MPSSRPSTADKRKTFMGMDVSLKDGGRQIEYEDQNPEIHELYAKELAKSGAEMRMQDFVTARG